MKRQSVGRAQLAIGALALFVSIIGFSLVVTFGLLAQLEDGVLATTSAWEQAKSVDYAIVSGIMTGQLVLQAQSAKSAIYMLGAVGLTIAVLSASLMLQGLANEGR